MRRVLLLSVLAATAALSAEPETQLLWPSGAPGAVGNEKADRPTLTIYRSPADKRTGTAIVICPGGGYAYLASSYEGHDVAAWFNSLGVTAAVLEYRVGPRYRHPAPLEDARRAVRILRARAEEIGVAPDRIGLMGFSAGGHLAALAATRPLPPDENSADVVEKQASAINFLVLAYPVVSMREFAHAGSKDKLVGTQADSKVITEVSPEIHVNANTPPTFLFHTDADTAVAAENSVLFYGALRKARVPAELHIFESGPHGVGLAFKDPSLSAWPTLLANWLRSRHLLDPAL